MKWLKRHVLPQGDFALANEGGLQKQHTTMIRYESKSCLSSMRVEGSVFPRAGKYAVLISLVATLFKFADEKEILDIQRLQTGKESALFSGFTFTLGFILVFRTNICYTRFHTGSQSACTMRSKLLDAASNIAAFTTRDVARNKSTEEFIHKVVRLFSLAHASALEVICELPDQEFPVLDVDGLMAEDMRPLTRLSGHLRVDLVFMWINTVIMDGLYSGLISAPAPIVSRAFQDLEQSKAEFHQMLQIISIPVPFPYSQVATVLLIIYSMLAPLLVVLWTAHPVTTFFVTFITTLPMWSIELIAAEIEHPFGDDVNDLPVFEFQQDMNESLLLLIDPCSRRVPRLSPNADFTMHVSHRKSLRELTQEFKLHELDTSRDCNGCDVVSEGSAGSQTSKRSEEDEAIAKIALPASHIAHATPACFWLMASKDPTSSRVEPTKPVYKESPGTVHDVNPVVPQSIQYIPKLGSPDATRESTGKSSDLAEVCNVLGQQQGLSLDPLRSQHSEQILVDI